MQNRYNGYLRRLMNKQVLNRVSKKALFGWAFLMALLGITGVLLVTNGHARLDTRLPEPVGSTPIATVAFTYDSTKKYIYLTFDDGPQQGTVNCFNLCRSEGVKASFFMVGIHADMKSDGHQIVNQIRSAYPQSLLANHSFTHARNKYFDFYRHPRAAAADFFLSQKTLQVPYLIARLPGNRSWVRQGELKACSLVRPVAQLLDSAGYNVIGWDLEWDFNRKSAQLLQSAEKLARDVDSAFARFNTHVPRHLVILTHDRMFRRPADTDSLVKFIQILKKNPNYVFETVDHYPGLKKLRP